MATQSMIDQVQSMYVAYYGRPGDPAGVAYWAQRLDAVAGNLDEIVDAFGWSQEYLERFGALDEAEMIHTFYRQIFNRDADGAGLAFYLGELAAGRMTLATIAKNIWDGAVNADALIVANKLEAAGHFTGRIDAEAKLYAGEDVDEAAAALARVDASPESLAAGVAALDDLVDALPPAGPPALEVAATAEVREGDAVLIRVELPDHAGTAEVSYRTEPDSAASGVDFIPETGRLVFGPGEDVLEIRLQSLPDALVEDGEGFRLVLHDPEGAGLPGSGESFAVAVRIEDDDSGPREPTDHEQYLLELINRARSDPAAEAARWGIDLNEGLAPGTLTPEARQPLAFDPNLTDAALGHAAWMLETDTFSHTGEGGSSPGERIEAEGYLDWRAYAENLAWQGTTGDYGDLTEWVEELHEGLFVDEGIAGRGHRLNYLNGELREAGVGILTGGFDQYNAMMIANDYAVSLDGLDLLTGVVYRDADLDGFYTPGEGIEDVLVRVSGAAGIYSTYSMQSGGYQIELPSGNYGVELLAPEGAVMETEIDLAGLNEKLDWVL